MRNSTLSFYWYDQHGRRIAKSEAGLLTLYIWDGMDIIATAHADGTIREYYTRGIGIAGDVGSLIAETKFENNTPVSTVYLHSNWRGDVVMATDTSGNVVGEYSYTTFGEQLSATGTYIPRFTFSGKERDASGLVYHGFRYYSPVLCRWISEDPIRERGGINLYQFCGNDPVNRVDTDGKSFWGTTGVTAFLGVLGTMIVAQHMADYGNAYAVTLRPFGIPLGIVTGKNFDCLTQAGKSVILEHEMMHMHGAGELAAYQRQLLVATGYLSEGRYGDYLGTGRNLTQEEIVELQHLKETAETMIEYLKAEQTPNPTWWSYWFK